MVRRLSERRAFTLVELLVVITIIGILIALALPAYDKVKKRAKELEVQNNLHKMDIGITTFSTNNNGWYPGVAYDANAQYDCNGDGTFERSYTCPQGGVFAAAGIVGTRMDYMLQPCSAPGIPCGPFMIAAPTTPDQARWDRLYQDNDLDSFDRNPFLTSNNYLRPMENIFEVTVPYPFDNVTPVAADPIQGVGADGVTRLQWVLGCLSTPNVDNSTWYTLAGFNTSARSAPAARTTIGGACNDILIPAVQARTGNGWDPGNQNPAFYPMGDFAYIPLDPVVNPDQDNNGRIDNALFMVFVQSYILVAYGSDLSWSKKSVVDVDAIASNVDCDATLMEGGEGLKFNRPLGRVNPANLATINDLATPYEIWAMKALRGGIFVKATAYNDQLLKACTQ
ncbi:MAG: type II secretion system protein [bacterium]